VLFRHEENHPDGCYRTAELWTDRVGLDGGTADSESVRFRYLRSLSAHRVSYFLKLKGPACNVDTACSSSLNALDVAFRAIRSGQCDNAIVSGSNLILHPSITLQFFQYCHLHTLINAFIISVFFRLGVLSKDGVCRVFDQDASGYVKGEAIVSIFLQKTKNARRIYAQIINIKVNSDGFKEQGITFPSTLTQ
jgi:fatty acid synthase